MKDELAMGFTIGLIAGALVVAFLAIFLVFPAAINGDIYEGSGKLIDECERSLTREQHCKLIAVPANQE